MKKIIFIGLSLCALLFIPSCNKDGRNGPKVDLSNLSSISIISLDGNSTGNFNDFKTALFTKLTKENSGITPDTVDLEIKVGGSFKPLDESSFRSSGNNRTKQLRITPKSGKAGQGLSNFKQVTVNFTGVVDPAGAVRFNLNDLRNLELKDEGNQVIVYDNGQNGFDAFKTALFSKLNTSGSSGIRQDTVDLSIEKSDSPANFEPLAVKHFNTAQEVTTARKIKITPKLAHKDKFIGENKVIEVTYGVRAPVVPPTKIKLADLKSSVTFNTPFAVGAGGFNKFKTDLFTDLGIDGSKVDLKIKNDNDSDFEELTDNHFSAIQSKTRRQIKITPKVGMDNSFEGREKDVTVTYSVAAAISGDGPTTKINLAGLDDIRSISISDGIPAGAPGIKDLKDKIIAELKTRKPLIVTNENANKLSIKIRNTANNGFENLADGHFVAGTNNVSKKIQISSSDETIFEGKSEDITVTYSVEKSKADELKEAVTAARAIINSGKGFAALKAAIADPTNNTLGEPTKKALKNFYESPKITGGTPDHNLGELVLALKDNSKKAAISSIQAILDNILESSGTALKTAYNDLIGVSASAAKLQLAAPNKTELIADLNTLKGHLEKASDNADAK